jgi:hypothetical protein
MSENEEIIPETTRQLAALYQITAAIEHFHKHELECSITLAAAAEGILPDAEGGFLFQQFKTRASTKKRENLDHLNFVQNWLKHGKYNGKEVESIGIAEFFAVISLLRAITKFVAVYRRETPDMAEFVDWSRDNGYPGREGNWKRRRLRIVRFG